MSYLIHSSILICGIRKENSQPIPLALLQPPRWILIHLLSSKNPDTISSHPASSQSDSLVSAASLQYLPHCAGRLQAICASDNHYFTSFTLNPQRDVKDEGTEQALVRKDSSIRQRRRQSLKSMNAGKRVNWQGTVITKFSKTYGSIDSEARMLNTSKPRANAATAGRVEKKKAPATKDKRTPTVTDKVKGVVEKVVGTIEGKPAKKVCCAAFTFPISLGFERYFHVNVLRRGWIAKGLTVTYRLPTRRRSRALLGRDLPNRRKLRPRHGLGDP